MGEKEEIEDYEENESNPSKKVKKPFTIRLDTDLLDRLERLGKKSSKAMVARNYLDLSRYIVLKPDSIDQIQTTDGTPLALLPIKLWGSILQSIPGAKQLTIGDELGKITNINSSLNKLHHSPHDKVSFLQDLGLFNCQEISGEYRGEKQTFLGIEAKNWPINVIHALLYRLLHNHQIPEDWMDIDPNVAEHIEDPEKIINKLKKTSAFRNKLNFVLEFQKELGGLRENFSDDCAYFKFARLII